MFQFLPALILLLLGAPSEIQGAAWRGALPPELMESRRLAELREEQGDAAQVLASLLTSTSGSEFSHALLRLLVLDTLASEEPVEQDSTLPDRTQARVATCQTPPIDDGFVSSQRSRDGPAGR